MATGITHDLAVSTEMIWLDKPAARSNLVSIAWIINRHYLTIKRVVEKKAWPLMMNSSYSMPAAVSMCQASISIIHHGTMGCKRTPHKNSIENWKQRNKHWNSVPKKKLRRHFGWIYQRSFNRCIECLNNLSRRTLQFMRDLSKIE